ncbi:HNH endonuclease [Burkholderia ubonensis]|uniref:HNH endonuclease n=1 Tax=Burkholderia ubonensis TaxID=101571 RepID=UPI0009B303EA|nr:HNH endonuclease [Burkholderia ubonensis]
MPNPGKLITFNGETMIMSAWAKKLGINPVTLRARLNRYGMSLERALTSKSLALTPSGDWYKAFGNGKRVHIAIAEEALGKPLPPKVEVHHVDENKMNNDPSNLVICQDHSYHALLHYRARALSESGNANNLRCVYCKKWDSPISMKKRGKSRVQSHHPKCHADYHAALRRKKATNQQD